MLIQCQSCNTKYRLNLERIPDRKTFVKCKRCGTPIFIDPGRESPGEGTRVLPPDATATPEQPPAAPDADVLVSCESCGAHYRVASQTLHRAGVKFKCSQCGHLFLPPPPEEAAPARGPGAGAPVFYPHAEAAGAAEPATLGEADMPLPDEQRMDALFDDLKEPRAAGVEGITSAGGEAREGITALGDLSGPFGDEPSPPEDPQRAYLEATSLEEEGETYQPPLGGTVPPDKKGRFFLQPGVFAKTEEEGLPAGVGGTGGDLPPIQPPADEPPSPAEPDLPPMPDEPNLSATAPLTPPEAEGHAESAGEDTPAIDPNLPALPPEPREGPGDSHGANQNPRVYPREHTPQSERRVFWMLLAAGVLVLALALFWGIWISEPSEERTPYTIERERVHQLALDETLGGRYVDNRASGQRLFVVEGALKNGFPHDEKIGWVRLRGTIYADIAQRKPLETAYSYLGNVLDDKQLSTWDLNAIRAYHSYNNGRKDVNYRIPAGTKVPFQILFAESGEKVERTVAEVVSYTRGGAPVFVAPRP